MAETSIAGVQYADGTVCAYVPVGAEPGSIEMLDVLLRRAAGCCCRSRVPLATTPRWPCSGVNTGRGSWWPRGSACSSRPDRGCRRTTVAEASVVYVPAVAVDRAGARLGRGRGFYDRTLVLRDPDARLIAVVRDEELLDEVPHEPHDVPMTHALTPGHGLVELARVSSREAPAASRLSPCPTPTADSRSSPRPGV